MADGQSAFAGPMTMQEALARADSLSRAKEAEPEEAPQEADEETVDDDETVEAEAEAPEDDTDDTDEPEAEDEESAQVLTVDDYGDVLIDLNGEPTPLSDVVKGTLRQADYSRKTMALSEERKAMQAEAAEREKALEAREQQLLALEAELGETEPDWEKLADEDPLGYPSAKAKWEKRQKAKAERQAKMKEREQERLQEFKSQTVQKALEAFPEWGDVQKFQQGADARRDAALALGFTEEEYSSTPDFRIASLLEKAARYDAMQKEQGKKRNLADKKIAKAPKVLKPGASKGDTDPKQERRAAFQKRLSKPVDSKDIIKNLGLR